jgi:hypothetical protein
MILPFMELVLLAIRGLQHTDTIGCHNKKNIAVLPTLVILTEQFL